MKKVILTEAKLKQLMVEMRFNQDIVFVSYLPEKFDRKKFKGIECDSRSQRLNKCKNGLWACPIDSNLGWEQWCKAEDFTSAIDKMKYSFFFKLRPGAKIYPIDNINDLNKISTAYQILDLGDRRVKQKKIDFTSLLAKGYDGIYASENAVRVLRNNCNIEMDELYYWDVESICIFNPNVIIPIGEDELMSKIAKYSDVDSYDGTLYSYKYDDERWDDQNDNPNRVTHYADDRDSWDLIDSYYNATSKNPPGEGRKKALKVNDINKAWKEHDDQEKKRKTADKRSMTNTLKAADNRPLIQKKQ
jgi:hypothetical protein